MRRSGINNHNNPRGIGAVRSRSVCEVGRAVRRPRSVSLPHPRDRTMMLQIPLSATTTPRSPSMTLAKRAWTGVRLLLPLPCPPPPPPPRQLSKPTAQIRTTLPRHRRVSRPITSPLRDSGSSRPIRGNRPGWRGCLSESSPSGMMRPSSQAAPRRWLPDGTSR